MDAHAIARPGRTLAQRAGAVLSPVGAFVERLAENSGPMRCAREADRLFALSDTELARLGLTRDRVVAHAFRSYMAS